MAENEIGTEEARLRRLVSTDGKILNEASTISDCDIPSVLLGLYFDVSIDIVHLFQSINGSKVLRKLIPKMRSPVANSSMTSADIVNLILQTSSCINTISLASAVDLSANVTLYDPPCSISMLLWVANCLLMKQHAAPLSTSAKAGIQSLIRQSCLSNFDTNGATGLGPVMVRLDRT